MWKKALWVYLGIFVLGVLYTLINYGIRTTQNNEFDLGTLLFSFIFFLPAVVINFQLRGKKVSLIFTIISLLIILFPVAGIFNFNNLNLETVGKALFFVPMIVSLVYFGFLQRKK